MPLPTPRQDENQSDFMSRCMSDSKVQEESSNREQAVAICMSQWRNREPKSMSINETLLKAIKNRGPKKEPFEYGILTADRWVLNLQDQIGLDNCYKFACKDMKSFGDVLNKASQTLTYSNKGMVVTDKRSAFDELELPKNTLMVFRHVLTSSNKDRDGDILRSKGMQVDPKMLLLWQHVHTLPIGKSIKVFNQDDNTIEMISAIVDMNELSHDAAVMIDNDMGRFSHGFRALEYEEIKSEEGNFTGFDITKAEIMEESLVSIPANVDAETQEVLLSLVGGGKLKSPIMKEYGKNLQEKQNLMIPGISFNITEGDSSKTLTCANADHFKEVFAMVLPEGVNDEKFSKGTNSGGEEKGTGNDTTPKETDGGDSKDEGTDDTKMQEVIEDVKMEEETEVKEEMEITVKVAFANILTKATDTEKREMIHVLEKSLVSKAVKDFNSIFGFDK